MPRINGTLSQETRDKIIEMADEGYSRKVICDTLGVSVGAVDYWTLNGGAVSGAPTPLYPSAKKSWKRAGQTIHPFEPKEDAIILRLRAQDMPYTHIARELMKRWPDRKRVGTTIKYRLMTLARHEARREEAEMQDAA